MLIPQIRTETSNLKNNDGYDMKSFGAWYSISYSIV